MKFLKLSSGISVVFGFIIAFYAFYIMSIVGESMNPEMTQAQYNLIKAFNVLCILLIAEGVYFVVAGVYALANMGEEEAALRIKKMGIYMLIMGSIDILIIIAGAYSSITVSGIFTIAMPFIIAVFYELGAILNLRSFKDDNKTLNSEE